MIAILLILILALQAYGPTAPALGAGTNNAVLIISETVTKRAWSRTAVMADSDNRPMGISGQPVAYSDAAAIGTAAAQAGEISDSARAAMTNAVNSLVAVTNQIPSSAQHVAISIPTMGQPNLQAVVVDEGSDGSNDWQSVKFNASLSAPPSRIIRYEYPGGTATVEVVWDWPWDRTGTVHRCVFPRPSILDGAVIRSRRHDLFGGPRGLSFGAALVKVDGVQTFTGSITNAETGAVMDFDNGVLKGIGERGGE